MEKLWKAAIGVGGIAGIGAFVFWSLYKDWLKLPIFSQLSQRQTFSVMILFLGLTFLALIAMLVVYLRTKHLENSPMTADVRLIGAALDRNNPKYQEDRLNGTPEIKPKNMSVKRK